MTATISLPLVWSFTADVLSERPCCCCYQQKQKDGSEFLLHFHSNFPSRIIVKRETSIIYAMTSLTRKSIMTNETQYTGTCLRQNGNF
jgi:hypothetical protein